MRFRTIFIALLCAQLCSFVLSPRVSGDEQDPYIERVGRILDVLRQEAEIERAKADKERFKVIERALEIRRQQQVAAGEERTVVQKAQHEIELVNESRKLVLNHFEPEKQGLLSRMNELSSRAKRLLDSRDRFTARLVQLPEASLGSVWSGRALNHFLTLSGDTIAQQQFDRIELARKHTALKQLLSNSLGDDPKLKESLIQVEVQLELLKRLRGRPVLDDRRRKQIQWKDGSGKLAAQYSEGRGPLSVDWALLNSLPRSPYKPYQRVVESLVRDALAQMRSTGSFRHETLSDLVAISMQMSKEHRPYIRRFMVKGDLYGVYEGIIPSIIRSRNIVEQFKIDVIGTVSATSIEDIEIAGDFNGETVDELAEYMNRKNFTFGPVTDPQSRSTYEKIYQEFVRHYLGMQAIRESIEYNEGKLYALKAHEERLIQTQYENTMAETAKLLRAAPEKTLAEKILLGAQIANESLGAWNELQRALRNRGP